MSDQASTQPQDVHEDLTTGIITFVQHYLPPLDAGDYTLTIDQRVQIPQTWDDESVDDHFSTTKRFTVRGERFRLSPTEFYAKFPPENSLGHYANCLPHLVFTRRTLPWERTLEGAKQKSDTDGSDVAPWLALLLFEEAEIPKVQQVTVRDLISPEKEAASQLPESTLSYPNLSADYPDSLDYGEKATDKCLVIDIPLALFLAIAPTSQDLKYLAHTRDVSLVRKEASATTPQTAHEPPAMGKFSVVIGNRLPQQGVKSTVHLVSLEGLASYLPSLQNEADRSNYTHIRLVSFKSWSFTAKEEKESFKGILEHVDSGTLQFPAAELSPPVAQILQAGYVAMNHHAQEGEKTLSWYRGPFAPTSGEQTIFPPVKSAAELTRQDPESGLFDISYAAAWQLGRLLALQNKHFARTLYNWKRANKQATTRLLEQRLMHEALSYGLDLSGVAVKDMNLTKAGLRLLTNHSLIDKVAEK